MLCFLRNQGVRDDFHSLCMNKDEKGGKHFTCQGGGSKNRITHVGGNVLLNVVSGLALLGNRRGHITGLRAFAQMGRRVSRNLALLGSLTLLK